jgi:arylsulfatase A-like enzyme
LIEGGVKGEYTDAAGTPTAAMQNEIQFADSAIGQMVNELKKQRLLDSTLIIITAKHGQSPVDTRMRQLSMLLMKATASTRLLEKHLQDYRSGFLIPPRAC